MSVLLPGINQQNVDCEHEDTAQKKKDAFKAVGRDNIDELKSALKNIEAKVWLG